MKKIIFIGSKELGLKVLMKIYNLTPERLIACITLNDGSDTRSKLLEFRNFCKTQQIPIHVLEGKCDITEIIHLYTPDICFVVGWYYLIPKQVIEFVPHGFIGIHNSLLPKYRGHAPLVWSMLNGEEIIGYSVFSFTKEMDKGNLWHQESIRINQNDYINDVLLKVEKSVLQFFDQKYLALINDQLQPYPQSEKNVSYGAKRVETDGYINWNQDNKKIYNFIRAQARPYPGAFSYYKKQKIIIWKARIFPDTFYGSPGQIGFINKDTDEITVICGDNSAIILEEIQIEDKIVKPNDIIKSLNNRFY